MDMRVRRFLAHITKEARVLRTLPSVNVETAAATP
jgi:hypothetical protein